MDRIIGELHSQSPKTLLICLGGVHGNEFEGIAALQNIFETIDESDLEINGSFVAMRGNIPALQLRSRFIDHDLNRAWGHLDVRSETIEQRQIAQIIHEVNRLESLHDYQRKVLIDLHATSAERGIFLVTEHGDAPESLAHLLPIPVLTKVNAILQNTSIDYFSQRGFEAMAFEGGQIGQRQTVANHIQTIWWALERLDMISQQDIPAEAQAYQGLKEAIKGIPKDFTFAYKHQIEPGEDFRMIEGFKNFDPIRQGQHLASNQHGMILAKIDGYILMPLYQKTGSDGFFIIRAIENPLRIEA